MSRTAGATAATVAPIAALFAAALLPLEAGGQDLDPCMEKPTYTASRCGPDTALACWSVIASADWHCLTEAAAAAVAVTAVAASSRCQATAIPAGGGALFDGACSFSASPVRPVLESPPAPGLPAPLSWDVAYAWARKTLAIMKATEKYQLMQGIGFAQGSWSPKKWWYVGNSAPIPHLGLPSLNMQDAGGGFRPIWSELIGTVTCWPSLLSMAATWDPDAVLRLAVAVGEEFAGKGANGILGPSIDVHRVARNGRNFEYLSGEDPYLGARLAKPYVQGVQSQGVFAVMKHWVFNVQETNRNTESSIVEDKVAWELYYPPFQAAIDAGVCAVMCSYNRVDGKYACSNEKHLKVVLKGQMGFRGFVQSDWWATHALSTSMGLDQEMPGNNRAFFTPEHLAGERAKVVDDSVTRILAVMHRMNFSNVTHCSPPHCRIHMRRNVTSNEHVALARDLATESIVLLKNDKDLLPLSASSTKTIAVLGAAAVARPFNPDGAGQDEGDWSTGDYYSGGGSGHVVAANVVTPLDGIKRRAEVEGITVIASENDHVQDAASVARQADVLVIVAATTSGENRDRPNLRLDGRADELIEMAATQGKPTIVLMQIPGAVLTPWRASANCILAMFLGGQETGSAWASVLFGDYAPTGRLPVMMPDTEADTIEPTPSLTIKYDEGMATSYRNRDFKAAFPFGHGLTYTAFEYLEPGTVPCEDAAAEATPGAAAEERRTVLCIRMLLRNTGSRPGRTVAQLYLKFPPVALHPSPLLRGFQRTSIVDAGASTEVIFRMSRRDVSYYDDGAEKWREADAVTALIGESSADVRQRLGLSRVGDGWRSKHRKRPVSTAKPSQAPAAPEGRPPSRSPDGVGTEATSFCCLSVPNETDPCGTCRTKAHAEPGTSCGQSQISCQACGFQTTWCEATVVTVHSPIQTVAPANAELNRQSSSADAGVTTAEPTTTPATTTTAALPPVTAGAATPVPAPLGQRVCPAAGQDCRGARCCSDPGMWCYEKNSMWAGCKRSCEPGIDMQDTPEYQTPWSCSLLDNSDPQRTTVVRDGSAPDAADATLRSTREDIAGAFVFAAFAALLAGAWYITRRPLKMHRPPDPPRSRRQRPPGGAGIQEYVPVKGQGSNDPQVQVTDHHTPFPGRSPIGP